MQMLSDDTRTYLEVMLAEVALASEEGRLVDASVAQNQIIEFVEELIGRTGKV